MNKDSNASPILSRLIFLTVNVHCMNFFRESDDILGVGLSRCSDTKAIVLESIKQASLADR